jgi:hypothetical protein
MRTARILSRLQGGTRALKADRDAAAEIARFWPQAARQFAWHDSFRARAAEFAVLGGAATVVFGDAGFPHGEPLCKLAAGASEHARFIYADPSAVVVILRRRSLDRDRSAALQGTVCDPGRVLADAGLLEITGPPGYEALTWLGDGPCQVQWGLAAGQMDGSRAAAVLARYGELLPARSTVVIAVPDGEQGRMFAKALHMHPHSPEDVAAWCAAAGMVPDGGVRDVRAWGRGRMGDGLHGDGRIVAAVARVPAGED